jgi:pimeloyl-ACP methyl ester carboxylesterase
MEQSPSGKTDMAQSFSIDIPDATLARIRRRVAEYRWPVEAEGAGWSLGMDADALRALQAHWLEAYDWRGCERELNQYPHYIAEVDGLDVHFVHVVGEAGGQRPLILTHGWPGSVYEFWDAIPRLAWPSRHGGDAADAFDLVIPSLPGYGWSGKPPAPIGPRATAALWDKLMREVLGYDTYLAQGGDWGAMVTSHLGHRHGTHDGQGGTLAIHLNMIGFRPTPATPQNEAETAWLTRTQAAMQVGGAYFMQQATKPQTLAYSLHDSPMGQLAWIAEKFHGWSDLREKRLLEAYTPDQLLTNVMIYLVNDAITTSVWFYNGFMAEGGPGLPEGERCETPTAFANFPGEALYAPPPRSWVERAYNLVRWSEIQTGGHFAAMEEPDLFVKDLRAWARELEHD